MKGNDRKVTEDILESNRRILVPVYQRNYDWKPEQCSRLFNDIINISNDNNAHHFIGSVIIQKGNDDDGREMIYLVDGQQRITSIFLMLKAMMDAIENKNSDLYQEIDDFLHITRGNRPIKIRLNKNDDIQFNAIFESDEKKFSPKSHVIQNYNWFLSSFKKLKEIQLSKFLNAFRRLVYIEILCESQDNAQIVFENINSTGLDLTPADLIRNFLLMTCDNMDLMYEKYWSKIEENVLLENMSQFVNHYIIYKIQGTISSKQTYSAFKMKYKDLGSSEEILSELLTVSDYYEKIIRISDTKSEEINNLLDEFKLFNQGTIYPLLISIIEDYEKGIAPENEVIKVLELLRNYLVRRQIVDPTMKNLNKFFASLYSNVYENQNNKNKYYDSFASYLLENVKSMDRYPNDVEFNNALLHSNLYEGDKHKILKYILSKYEMYGSKEKIEMNDISIEHIMPQTLTPEWTIELGNGWELVFDQYLHTLGNLTLTGYNSSLSNKTFKEKKDILKTKFSKLTRLNDLIMGEETWNEDAIVRRAETLTKEISNIFRSKLPNTQVEFKGVVKNTLNCTDDLNKTKVNFFEFDGHKYLTSSYSDMLTKVINLMYQNNQYEFSVMANQNFQMKSGRIVDLSFEEDKIRRHKKIEKSEIYYNTNYDPNDIIKFIGNIAEYVGYDKEEFIFYVNRDKNNSVKND